VINFDQNFVKFCSEAEYVIAPTGARCIGGKLKTNEKQVSH